jgi:hypothetical protein
LIGPANHISFTGSEFSVQAAFFSSLLRTKAGLRRAHSRIPAKFKIVCGERFVVR